MKDLDISAGTKTLEEVLQLASESNIILRSRDGRRFVLAEIGDFADEIKAISKNKALMRLLAERSKQPGSWTLQQVKVQLQETKPITKKARHKKLDGSA